MVSVQTANPHRLTVIGITVNKPRNGGVVIFAKRVGITTIAAQVECEEEMNAVRELEIDYVQGYFLGRPSFDLPRAPESDA